MKEVPRLLHSYSVSYTVNLRKGHNLLLQTKRHEVVIALYLPTRQKSYLKAFSIESGKKDGI